MTATAAVTTPWEPKIEIKKFRSCRGHDGDACSFDLWVDGKCVAQVVDDSWGGGLQHTWLDAKGQGTHLMTEAAVKMYDWVKGLPPVMFHGEPLTQNLDMALDDHITRATEEKTLRRWCKTKIVVKEPGAKEYQIYKAVYTPALKEKLAKNHPAGSEFVNERFL